MVEEKEKKLEPGVNSDTKSDDGSVGQTPEVGSGVLAPSADARVDISYKPAPTPEHKVEAGGLGFQSPEQAPALSKEEIEKQKKLPKNGWPEWWSGKRNVDGVETTITFDEIKRKYPNITASDYINAVGKFRGEVGLPVLDQRDWIVMRGNNAPDKTYKQQKRDAWRHFLVDAIQPVSDVLKAAVAYGYGKAGRTYIPIDSGDGSARAMSERMRRLEEVRAAQNWDAWAYTFRNKERERLQQEAEARRAAARGRQREEDFEDFERRETYKREHQQPKSAVELMKESQANAYLNYVGRGMSHEDAAIAAGLVRRGKSGGSGGGRGKSKARYYKVGNKKYPESQIEKALKHAYNIKNPNADATDIKEWFDDLTPLQQEKYLEENATLIEE